MHTLWPLILAVATHAAPLAENPNPYLLRCAASPVRWRDWNAGQLEARRSKRPLFVSLGSFSRWADQQVDSALNDVELASWIEHRFVPVKIDRDERPDLERAVTRVCALQSPTQVCVLTPELKPLARASPLDPSNLKSGLTKSPERSSNANEVAAAPDNVDAAALHLVARVQFLTASARGGSRDDLRELQVTLEQLARGRARDHVGGGFFVYTENREPPRFDKALWQNAVLLSAYIEVEDLTHSLFFRKIAEDTAQWLTREMRDSSGVFWSSMSASTIEGDGAFYRWKDSDLSRWLGPSRMQELLSIYRLLPSGLFELVGTPFAGLDASRDVLLNRRMRRARPAADDKAIAAWNGMAIAALARSGQVLGRASDVETARRAAETLFEKIRTGRVLRRCSRGNRVWQLALLEDYAGVADGALALFEVTRNEVWRSRARELLDEALRTLWDPQKGGFFDSAESALTPHAQSSTDLDRLPANALMAHVLLRLARDGGPSLYERREREVLKRFAEPMQTQPETLYWMRAAAVEAGPTSRRPSR